MEDIGDYMSTPILSIDSDSTVQETAQYMAANHVGALLVKEFDDYVGIVTEKDLTGKVLAKKKDPETMSVTEIMSQPILTMDRYLPPEEANTLMRKNKIRHLAITEEDKIVGIISVKDLVIFYSKSFRMAE